MNSNKEIDEAKKICGTLNDSIEFVKDLYKLMKEHHFYFSSNESISIVDDINKWKITNLGQYIDENSLIKSIHKLENILI